MCPHRRRRSHGLPQQLLFGGVRQVLLRADHMGDTHGHVVHDICQQKGRRKVTPGDDEVLQQGVLERRLAADEIDDDRRAVVWRAEAHGAALPPQGRGRGRRRARIPPFAQPPVPAEAVVAAVAVPGAGDDVLA